MPFPISRIEKSLSQEIFAEKNFTQDYVNNTFFFGFVQNKVKNNFPNFFHCYKC